MIHETSGRSACGPIHETVRGPIRRPVRETIHETLREDAICETIHEMLREDAICETIHETLREEADPWSLEADPCVSIRLDTAERLGTTVEANEFFRKMRDQRVRGVALREGAS